MVLDKKYGTSFLAVEELENYFNKIFLDSESSENKNNIALLLEKISELKNTLFLKNKVASHNSFKAMNDFFFEKFVST